MANETVYRNCSLCEAHCGIAIEVERDTDRILTIRGDAEDPFSRGYICPKAYGLKGLHEDPDRLRRPLRRDGDTWREIDWDEAFALVATRLRAVRDAHGPAAIASYAGNPNVHELGAGLYLPALLRALGNHKRFSASSVDQLPKQLSSLSMYGRGLTIPIPDIDRTRYLLVLGANPAVSNGSLMTAPDMPGRLARLRERGGKLVVIDPRRTETARLADEHHFIRPGGDAFFLFSLVHVLFTEDLVRLGDIAPWVRGTGELRALAAAFPPEATAARTGIDAATVRRLARELAAAESAACYGRMGTCTQEFGTLASWLVDCVTILTGNLDRPGGAMFPHAATSLTDDAPRSAKLPYARWRSAVRGLPEAFGELPSAALAEEIEGNGSERIRALVTVAGNPALSCPNSARLARALASLDFMVSIDIYLNETTRFADVILPPR
jgi:anaerobic selenocysteine-containing dehydrogenase